MGTKKHKVMSLVGKIIAGVGIFACANIVAGAYIGKRNTDKIKEKENQNNQVNTGILCKGKMAIKPDTDNAYVACLTGGMEIKVPKPLHGAMNIEITSFLSDVKVYVPADVRITYDGPLSSKGTGDADVTETEKLPQIHFTVKSKFSKVVFIHY